MPRTATTIVLAAALLVLGACSPAGDGEAAATTVAPARADAALAQTGGPVPGPAATGITVSGVGRITGVPDTLRATVGVTARRSSVQEALDAANAAADRVLGALDDAGVAEEDVTTTQFSVTPQFAQDGATITGYEVANLVEATLRDLDAVGATLDAVVRAGGDDARVQGVEYRLEDNAALLAEARTAAVDDARSSAEQYAAAAGVELGPLTTLSEVTADQPIARQFAMDQSAGGEAAAAVPLAPGTQEVGVTVTATWSLS